MSDQWRILVVEDEENLNWSIVNSLRKDGYIVRGVMNGAEAIRILWSEEFDLVISDLKMPGADGFELLQWIRANRPQTRLIMVTAFGSASTRTQALEGGVVSYLEKPLDLHLLKEELRRLLQQTGFSANLDSFDLLDVIQIITMGRKSIALLVNTGLEEQGLLRFQGGELIWAEYGILRGEEAFFALAAHKNGTVSHQLWNEQITPNVTQPLSRLIFQALQYRTKYAALENGTEQEAVAPTSLGEEIDDESMLALTEPQSDPLSAAMSYEQAEAREWWQQTGGLPSLDSNIGSVHESATGERTNAANIIPSIAHKTPAGQRPDLPSWLTDQPTNSNLPVLRPASLSNSAQIPTVGAGHTQGADGVSSRNRAATSGGHEAPEETPLPIPPPPVQPSPAEWRPPPSTPKTTEQVSSKQVTGPQKPVSKGTRQASSPEWQPPENVSQPQSPQSGPLQSLSLARKTSDALSHNGGQESGPLAAQGSASSQRTLKRNIPGLVTALQTLGYSIPGFIAAAVVSLDGHPIAQVAVDDLDLSGMCGHFSSILQGTLQSLYQGGWGDYEDTVITSADRHILLRVVGSN